MASNWASASADLALYCLKQSADGSGDYLDADTAVSRLINITRGHTDETYEIDGVTYRQALSDKASDLQDCDSALTAKIDRALATLE